MRNNKAKPLTVRLPGEVYGAASEVAKRRRVSMNRLIQESLQAALRQDEQARLYEAFGVVGADAAESDVEFAFDTQREVVASGDA